MKIISWNVNGIRAAKQKGFLDWLAAEQPDILCVQETKAHPEQLSQDLLAPPGYTVYWASAERKGYSGVATFVKETALPQAVNVGFGYETYDNEGRVIATQHPDFILFNVYFPNGGRDLKRVDYKLAFYRDLLKHCQNLQAKGQQIIIGGDFNTAHQEIDLANPKANQKNTGFLPEERAWVDHYLAAGFRDVFREFNQETGQYSWWSYRSGARERNIGWRIDYFLVTEGLAVQSAYLLPEVMGSDHCPVVLKL